MRAASWTDPTAGLASGDVDAALLRLPFPGQDTLRTEVLFTEPRWVALPARHPLATRDVIGFRELWDDPFVAASAETSSWREWWLAAGEREGHPVRIGTVTETGQPDDWLTAIANGQGIALAPESAARYYARPGITYPPGTGLSPSQVGVAWPHAADTSPVVQGLRPLLPGPLPRPAVTARPGLAWLPPCPAAPMSAGLFIRTNGGGQFQALARWPFCDKRTSDDIFGT